MYFSRGGPWREIYCRLCCIFASHFIGWYVYVQQRHYQTMVCVEYVGGVATQIVNKKIRYIFGKLLYHSYATGLIFGQAVLREENNPLPFPLSSLHITRRRHHRVHRVATAAFQRTFIDEGKIGPGWCGWGVHANPLSLHLPSPVKLQCTLQLSGQQGAVILTFFHILRYNHPSLAPSGPKDLEIGKKLFSTSSMACGNFWQKPENAFFWYDFKV